MKTSDGAFHQCFNGQAVVDSKAQVIVVAELSDEAPDQRQLEPRSTSSRRTSRRSRPASPEDAQLLADAAYFCEQRQDHRRAWP